MFLPDLVAWHVVFWWLGLIRLHVAPWDGSDFDGLCDGWWQLCDGCGGFVGMSVCVIFFLIKIDLFNNYILI